MEHDWSKDYAIQYWSRGLGNVNRPKNVIATWLFEMLIEGVLRVGLGLGSVLGWIEDVRSWEPARRS